ncbi:MAG: hypothetical protein OHK0017_11510 [Patescibacteria group bacterium]
MSKTNEQVEKNLKQTKKTPKAKTAEESQAIQKPKTENEIKPRKRIKSEKVVSEESVVTGLNEKELSHDIKPEVTESGNNIQKNKTGRTALDWMWLVCKVATSFFFVLILAVVVYSQYQNYLEIKDLRQTLDEMSGPWSTAYTHVREMPVSRTKLQQCLNNDLIQIDSKISASVNDAQAGQIQGTPFSMVYDKQTGKRFYLSGYTSQEGIKQFMDAARLGQQIQTGENGDHSKLKNPDLETETYLGSKDARFVWVLYSDYECPYCKNFYPEITKYVKANTDMVLVYRHLPLTSIHPNAQSLAQMSECVLKEYGQEAFWDYTDRVEGIKK